MFTAIKIVVEKIKAVSNAHTSGLYSDEEYRHAMKILINMLEQMVHEEIDEKIIEENE